METIRSVALIRGQLFSSISNELPMNEGPFFINASDRPGSKPEEPLAFIVPAIDLSFDVTVKMKRTWDPEKQDLKYSSKFLSVTADEVLHTDGVVRTELLSPVSYADRVFWALNNQGSLGYILESEVLVHKTK